MNVRGLWQLSQRVARHMTSRAAARSPRPSISGFRGSVEENEPAIAYSARKGAVNTLTQGHGGEARAHGIRVNAIAPGPFDTDMMDYVRDDAEKLASFLDQIPQRALGRRGRRQGRGRLPASDAAAYVTGHTLVVDGGWLVRG